MTEPKMPSGLGNAGQTLWIEIANVWELRPDELRILADACREADLVERIEAELVESPLMVKGSMGQKVASPLVSEVRQHRAVLSSLLRALKLPDEPAGEKRKSQHVSEQARAAARARWGTRTA